MATVPGIRAARYAPPRTGPRLPLLDAYVLKALVAPFGFAFGAYLVFWFVNIFFVAADYIINAHAPPFLVLRFLLFRVPQATPLAFPFACLFAALLAFGRLAQDNEITALRTSGVRFVRICVTPLLFGLGMFGTSYWINETLAPKSVELSTRTFYQIVYHTAELPIIPQFFRKDDATDRVFYVGNVAQDKRTMDDVMIFEAPTANQFRQVTNARQAVVDGQTLLLRDARVTRFKPDGAVDGTSIVKQIAVGLPLGETVDTFVNTTSADPSSVDSATLRTQIASMKATGQGGSALGILEITLAQRLAFPFASFISVILALPLAADIGKRGRSLGMAMGIALSILLLFVYFLLMSAFLALGKNGAMAPVLAAWMPNVIMFTAGMILFRRVER